MNNKKLIGGKSKVQHSSALHSRTAKSKTLHKAIRTKGEANSKQKSTSQIKQVKKIDITKVEAKNTPKKVERFKTESSSSYSNKKSTPKAKRPAPVADRNLTNKDKKDALISQAMNTASSSDSGGKRRKRQAPRFGALTASAASALLLIGYVTYLNIPNISLRIAASQAGVDTSLPNYNPPGFKFDGPASHSDGELSLAFKSSNNIEHSYSLIQKKSNWDTQTLLTNVLESNETTYQAHQTNGLTIYTTEEGYATWVNGGFWYKIENNAQLSNEQLIAIATSII